MNKAKTKLETEVDQKCAAQMPDFGILLTPDPNAPAEIDTERANELALEKELSLIRDIFGSDLDVAIGFNPVVVSPHECLANR